MVMFDAVAYVYLIRPGSLLETGFMRVGDGPVDPYMKIPGS